MKALRDVSTPTMVVLVMIITLLSASVAAQPQVTVSLSGPGAAGDTIIIGQPVTFNVHFNNTTGKYIKAFTNGFSISSSDGASWDPLTYDTTGGLGSFFDGTVWSGAFSNDGIGADTVAVGASAETYNGFPPDCVDVVLTMSTVFRCCDGDTIQIDSSWFPPAGTWVWAHADASYTTPTWGGPYGFTTKGPSTVFHADKPQYIGSPCCWQFDFHQHYGAPSQPGVNVVSVKATVQSTSIVVASASGPSGAAGPQITTNANGHPVIEYYTRPPDGMYQDPHTAYACFDNMPQGGVWIRFEGFDEYGNRFPKTFEYKISTKGECACAHPPAGMPFWAPLDEAAGPKARNVRGPVALDGTHYGGLSIVTGQVSNALVFNGSDSYVEFPHWKAFDITLGDFSIDAWVQRQMADDGTRIIAEKRTQSGSDYYGYSLFLLNGKPGIQIACGPFNNWVSPNLTVPVDGAWHHVAITVDRDNPQGIGFYVDGVKDTYLGNPTGYQASFGNSSFLRIGGRTLITPPTGVFLGGIDEVEIFRRALKETEIKAIFDAAYHGKCKKLAVMPFTLSSSAGVPTAGSAVITNASIGPVTFDYSFAGTPDTLPIDLVFNPSSGSITVQPGACAEVHYGISASGSMEPGQTVYYEMTVEDGSSGNTNLEVGAVTTGNPFAAAFSKTYAEGEVDSTVDLGKVTVRNIGDVLSIFDYRIVAGLYQGDTLCVDSGWWPAAISLNDLTPGLAIRGLESVPAGDSITVPLTGTFVEYYLLDYCGVVLQQWADSQWTTLSSMFFINVPESFSCCVGNRGNVNGDAGDGTDISDLTFLVSFLFQGGSEPPCPEEADVNGDGASLPNISDLTFLVDFLFRGGSIPPACGGVAKARVGEYRSDIVLSTIHDDSGTVIAISSPVDLRGLQLELRGESCARIINLDDPGLETISGKPASEFSLGLVDLQGEAVISSGQRNLVRLSGNCRITAARLSDMAHNSIVPSLASSSGPLVPESYALSQNYPNPFNPTTEIAFSIPAAGEVNLTVYNVLGQQVAELAGGRYEAGRHTVTWDASNQSSGVFLYRLRTRDYSEAKKMLLLK